MTDKEIIDRIGYFRTKAGLTQRALSVEIDVNTGYINRLECKKDFLPSMSVLMRIIEACGTTAEEFFYSSPETYASDKILLDKIKNLPSDKREALMKLLV